MGSTSSTLHPNVVLYLTKKTSFSAKEVRLLRRCFLHAVPQSEFDINREAFIKFYQKSYPSAEHVQFAQHAFRLFDFNKDGKVDFHEFVMLMNTQLKGNRNDRLELLFKLYDIEGNQLVSQEEAREIIEQLASLQAGYVPGDNLASPEFITAALFRKIGGSTMQPQVFYKHAINSPVLKSILDGSIRAMFQPFLLGYKLDTID